MTRVTSPLLSPISLSTVPFWKKVHVDSFFSFFFREGEDIGSYYCPSPIDHSPLLLLLDSTVTLRSEYWFFSSFFFREGGDIGSYYYCPSPLDHSPLFLLRDSTVTLRGEWKISRGPDGTTRNRLLPTITAPTRTVWEDSRGSTATHWTPTAGGTLCGVFPVKGPCGVTSWGHLSVKSYPSNSITCMTKQNKKFSVL